MVFPTGQHLSRRWRAASYVMVGLATLIALASALWPIEDDWRRSDLVFPFDLGGEDAARAIVWPLMLSCYSGFQVMWAAAVVTRLRRAGSDEVRQLRWFVFAVAVSLLLLLVGQIVWQHAAARVCSPSRWCRSRRGWRSSDTGSTTSTR